MNSFLRFLTLWATISGGFIAILVVGFGLLFGPVIALTTLGAGELPSAVGGILIGFALIFGLIIAINEL